MTDLAMTKLLGTAIFAGLVAIASSVVIERYGGRLGGILATVPTTIIPASIGFFLLTDTTKAFTAALWAVPIGMLLNAVFLHSWRWLPNCFRFSNDLIHLGAVVMSSLLLWFLLAVCSVHLIRSCAAWIHWIGGLASLIQLFYGLHASNRTSPSPTSMRKVGLLTLLSRGLMAALAIAVATFISALGQPLLAGIASVFPAIFLTVMVSVWLSQGPSVQGAAVGPMMLGSTSVSAYALIASWAIPTFGLVLGPLAAWFLSVLFVSMPSAKRLHRR